MSERLATMEELPADYRTALQRQSVAPAWPMLGFSARWLRPGEELAPTPRSSSAGFLVIEGEGESKIDGQMLRWGENDVVAIPAHAQVRHRNGSVQRPVCSIEVDDVPLQRKLGIYEEFNGAG